MTLVLPESDRLVAPVGLLFVSPLSFISQELEALPFMLEPPDEAIVPADVAIMRRLAEDYADSPTAAARLAQAEQSMGEEVQAITAAQRTLELVARTPDAAATAVAIQVLISSGRFDDARRGLELLPDRDVRGVLGARLAVHDGDLDAALGWLDGLASFDALSMKGWVYLQRAEWPQAIHSLRAAINTTERPTPGVLVNLGYAYAALGSLKKAIRATKQAHQLNLESEPIAYNLVAFYRACGDIEAASQEIKDLQSRHPRNVRAHFAEADLRLASGDPVGAEKVLRRARTSSLWASADTLERAELAANLAFVAWRTGRRSREATRESVIEELERTEHRSSQIPLMLPALMTTTDDADQLARVLTSLENANPTEPFDFLRIHLAWLRVDFDEATRLAADYARRDTFNAAAAAQAVYLLSDFWCDYEAAIEIGYSMLKRVPSSEPLRNNLAYALAYANRRDEARAIMAAATGESVYLSATAALIDLLDGRTDAGMAGYHEAYELASKTNDKKLATLVTLSMLLALHRLIKQRPTMDVHLPPPLSLPSDWSHDPRVVLLARIAEKEGLPVVETRPDFVS